MNKWDKRMLRVAAEVASWSKDKNRKVGCVITTMGYHIVSTGYNGYPRHIYDDCKDSSTKNFKSIHAEANAALRLPGVDGAYRAFVYGGHPCAQCAAILIQCGCIAFTVPKLDDDSEWRASMTEAHDMMQALSLYESYEPSILFAPKYA